VVDHLRRTVNAANCRVHVPERVLPFGTRPFREQRLQLGPDHRERVGVVFVVCVDEVLLVDRLTERSPELRLERCDGDPFAVCRFVAIVPRELARQMGVSRPWFFGVAGQRLIGDRLGERRDDVAHRDIDVLTTGVPEFSR